MRLISVAIIVSAPMLVLPSVAQEIPYRGFVTSVEQNSGLTFECSGQGSSIKCDFIQTMVSQESPATAEQTANMVAQMLEESASTTLCTELVQQFEIIRNGGDFGVELSTRERDDANAYGDLLRAFCSNPSELTALAMVEAQDERKTRTCKIGTLPFELNFNWNNQSSRWEYVSAPEGGCGIVTMSFMERDAEASYFWNYREQTVVTNKNGVDAIRGNCSAWPEETQFYRWQPDTLKRSCEYVSFGF